MESLTAISARAWQPRVAARLWLVALRHVAPTPKALYLEAQGRAAHPGYARKIMGYPEGVTSIRDFTTRDNSTRCTPSQMECAPRFDLTPLGYPKHRTHHPRVRWRDPGLRDTTALRLEGSRAHAHFP